MFDPLMGSIALKSIHSLQRKVVIKAGPKTVRRVVILIVKMYRTARQVIRSEMAVVMKLLLKANPVRPAITMVAMEPVTKMKMLQRTKSALTAIQWMEQHAATSIVRALQAARAE